jgi:uncharacterized protein YbjT (DUF2867 family)
VVKRLLAVGQSVRVLSRREHPNVPPGVGAVRGDLATGGGLAQAVAGAETIVHCASSGHGHGDIEATRQLVDAAVQAGVRHLVYISIVGVDRVPFGYYRAKLAAEGIVATGRVPWTILRSTQFHSLLLRAVQVQGRLPVLLVPRGISFQPVDAGEVAARLVELALAEPAGRVPDMGGPEMRAAEDLARVYLAVAGRRRPLLGVPVPGAVGRALRNGAGCAPDHADGVITWSDYLTHRLGTDPARVGSQSPA